MDASMPVARPRPPPPASSLTSRCRASRRVVIASGRVARHGLGHDLPLLPSIPPAALLQSVRSSPQPPPPKPEPAVLLIGAFCPVLAAASRRAAARICAARLP
ncbi:hypothetical protein ZWY2020_004568 [Hordeum vulgare]|nr:hypothetical protein ZWY2020_004568 [Hordeum vulgare]